jgi:hypothetical protein
MTDRERESENEKNERNEGNREGEIERREGERDR